MSVKRYDDRRVFFEDFHRNLPHYIYMIDTDLAHERDFKVFQNSPVSVNIFKSFQTHMLEGNFFTEFVFLEDDNRKLIRNFADVAYFCKIKDSLDNIQNNTILEYGIDKFYRIGRFQEIYPKFFLVTGPEEYGPWTIHEFSVPERKLTGLSVKVYPGESWISQWGILGLFELRKTIHTLINTRGMNIDNRLSSPFGFQKEVILYTDLKTSRKYVDELLKEEINKYKTAYYLWLCRIIGMTQRSDPKFIILVNGKSSDIFNVVEINIYNGKIVRDFGCESKHLLNRLDIPDLQEENVVSILKKYQIIRQKIDIRTKDFQVHRRQ